MIGRLWSGLKDRSLDDKINIILVGDHGTVFFYLIILINLIAISMHAGIDKNVVEFKYYLVYLLFLICALKSKFHVEGNLRFFLLNEVYGMYV